MSEQAINSIYKTKSISKFRILPTAMPEDNERYHFIDNEGLGVSYCNSDVIDFEPVFEEKEFEFSSEIKELNTKKLKSLSKMTRNEK